MRSVVMLLWLPLAIGGGVVLGHAGCAERGEGGAAPSNGGGGDGGQAGDAITVGSGGAGGGVVCDPGLASADDDLDGFSEDQGDCNDCDANANPNAIEVIAEAGDGGMPADENCDGTIDEPFLPCDADFAIDDLDPDHAAAALEMCQRAGDGVDWGLVSAAYVNADGTPAAPSFNVGLLPKFGDYLLPRAGSTMLGLSSGFARDVSQPDNCGDGACSVKGAGVAPPGFPQVVPGCETAMYTNDDVGLEIVVRAPSNAHGYAFDLAFFSFEFPVYVCSAFNDQFVALVDPPPGDALNGNVSFDAFGNPISVNLAAFDHCDPERIDYFADVCNILTNSCPAPPSPYCPAGTQLLDGTGFNEWSNGGSGSTGWLTTTAPIVPGESARVRFAIWDASDYSHDSTVVIDQLRWLAEPAVVQTVPALR